MFLTQVPPVVSQVEGCNRCPASMTLTHGTKLGPYAIVSQLWSEVALAMALLGCRTTQEIQASHVR